MTPNSFSPLHSPRLFLNYLPWPHRNTQGPLWVRDGNMAQSDQNVYGRERPRPRSTRGWLRPRVESWGILQSEPPAGDAHERVMKMSASETSVRVSKTAAVSFLPGKTVFSSISERQLSGHSCFIISNSLQTHTPPSSACPSLADPVADPDPQDTRPLRGMREAPDRRPPIDVGMSDRSAASAVGKRESR